MFEILIWIGTAMSLAGLVGLIWCIAKVIRARRAGLGDDALRGVLQQVLPWNLGALFLSIIGLMLVVIGVVLA